MTTEPEENVTDASPSQTGSAGPESAPGPDSGDGSGDAAPNRSPQPPRWSDSQPAPAPWYVGRPGAAPQSQAGWGVAMPPQQPAPPPAGAEDAAGAEGTTGAQDADGAEGAAGAGDSEADSGKPETPGDQPEQSGQSDQSPEAQGTPGTPEPPPIAPPQPPQNPYDQPGPFGPPPPPMPPWQDPNRYGPPRPQQPPNQQQDDPWQRQRQQRQPAEQEKRQPLDLRTRWARGLALGAIGCTLLAIWYSISNFPTWMVGAGAGLVLGLTGLWLGVFAQRAALAKGKRAPEAVGAIVWSSIASLLSLMILAFSLIFYTQLSQLSNCLRSATTISAQNQCETNFQNDFGTRG
ncbi:hypothetical protein [Actinospica sp.]|uniref:hypothetical protein n=1 Tax=Actinospica sp. TaxID=1872142 RepID=UPI002B744121|nr:hypothetical protein [Actinospica sp.]HWG23825.1 hypothetical protein [Actinospica sp.]